MGVSEMFRFKNLVLLVVLVGVAYNSLAMNPDEKMSDFSSGKSSKSFLKKRRRSSQKDKKPSAKRRKSNKSDAVSTENLTPQIQHKLFPFTGLPLGFFDRVYQGVKSFFGYQEPEELTEQQIFSGYLQRHNIDISRFERFEKKLEQQAQVCIAADCLEYFFSAASDQEFEEMLLRGKKSLVKNPVRTKLAKKWIRNAAVRIFNDDIRSILEVVVNACDASLLPALSVGKFGMGFFSILSLLGFEQTNGCEIVIDTSYQTSKGIESYSMTFRKTGAPGVWSSQDDISIGFVGKPLKQKEHLNETDCTGTTVSIKPLEGAFSKDVAEKIRSYIYFMKFYEHVCVKLNYFGNQEIVNSIIFGQSQENLEQVLNISIELNEKGLLVSDHGTGIPLHVALLKLLIPSSSTKMASSLEALRNQIRQQPAQAPYLAFRQPGDPFGKSKSCMLMTVNGVVVISRPIKTIVNENGVIQDLVMPLPQAMLLTLARDDFEISPDGTSFEEEQIKRLIDSAIHLVLQKNQNTNSKILLALYDGLNVWEECSAAQHIKGRFTGYLKSALNARIIENEKIIPLPENTASCLECIINPLGIDHNYILLKLPDALINYNFSRVEDLLHEYFFAIVQGNQIMRDALDGKLIEGQRVYFVYDDYLPKLENGRAVITSLKLKSTMFVPLSMLRDTRHATGENIIASVGDCILRAARDETPREFSPVIVNTYADVFNKESASIPIIFEKVNELLPDAKIFVEKLQTILAVVQNETNRLQAQDLTCVPDTDQSALGVFEKATEDLYAALEEFDASFGDLPFKNIPWDDDDAFADKQPQERLFFRALKRATNICKEFSSERIMNVYTPVLLSYLFGMTNGRTADLISEGANSQLIHQREALIRTNMKPNAQEILKEFICNDAWENAIKPIYGYQVKGLQALAIMLHNKTIIFSQKNRPFSMSLMRRFQASSMLLAGAQKCCSALNLDSLKLLVKMQEAALSKEQASIREALSTAQRGFERGFDCSVEAADIQKLEEKIRTLEAEIDPAKAGDSTELAVVKQSLNDLIDKRIDSCNKQIKSLKDCCAMKKELEETLHFNSSEFKKAMKDPLVIHKKGADHEAIIKALFGQAKRLVSHCATLQPAIKDLDLAYKALIQIALLELDCKDVSFNNKHHLKFLFSTLYSCYDHYLNIDDNEFRRTYGNSKKDQAISSAPDVDADVVINLLLMLDLDKDLLHKLVVFQNNDFAFQTSIENRKQDLLNHQLYIPTILNNTPCSLLAKLFQETNSFELVQEVLRVACSPEELSLIVHVLLHKKNIDIIKVISPQTIVNQVRFLVEEFIRSRVDYRDIFAIYQANRSCQNLAERITFLEQTIIVHTIADYLAQISDLHQIFQVLDIASINQESLIGCLNQAQPWMLSRLMRAHTTGKGILQDLINGDINALNQKMKRVAQPLDTSKITQAVEAGSEKNPVEAAIVECLQNSIDAIKSFFKKLDQNEQTVCTSYQARQDRMSDQNIDEQMKSVNYQLTRVTGHQAGHEQMLLTITDHIGMPGLETLLTDLMLPDYSNKSPAQGNIGDMGNGTFKLYQDAAGVIFMTRSVRKPDQLFALQVEPIRNEDGLVQDLEIKCSDVSHLEAYKDFFGTRICVLFRPEEHEKNTLKLFATRNFLLNCCGSTNASVQIGGNFELIQVLLTTLQGSQLINQPEDVIYSDNQYKAFKRSGMLQSYITTNGVPFRPLNDVAKQMNLLPGNLISLINEGVVIDLAPGTYEPVQSRTQLKMNHDAYKHLVRFTQEAAYREGILRAKSNPNLLDLYFTHYFSKVSLDQLVPGLDGFEELKKAFDGGVDTIPYQLFFRYYCSLDSAIKPFAYRVFEFKNKIFDPFVYKVKRMKQNILYEWPLQNGVYDCHSDEKKENFIKDWKVHFERQNLSQMYDNFTQQVLDYLNQGREQTCINSVVQNITSQWIGKKLTEEMSFSAEQYFDALYKIYKHLRTDQETQVIKKQQAIFEPLLAMNMNFSLREVLCHCLDSYCKLVIPNTPGKFFAENGSTLGLWDGTAINVNLARISITQYLKLVQLLFAGSLEEIPEDPAYQKLFAPNKGSAPVVVHELEHTARHSEHNQEGSHDDGMSVNGIPLTFDACAVARVKRAVQNDLLNKWSVDVRSRLMGIDELMLKKIIAEVQRLEKEHTDKKLELAEAILNQK